MRTHVVDMAIRKFEPCAYTRVSSIQNFFFFEIQIKCLRFFPSLSVFTTLRWGVRMKEKRQESLKVYTREEEEEPSVLGVGVCRIGRLGGGVSWPRFFDLSEESSQTTVH